VTGADFYLKKQATSVINLWSAEVFIFCSVNILIYGVFKSGGNNLIETFLGILMIWCYGGLTVI
jgi:hypothetical protein